MFDGWHFAFVQLENNLAGSYQIDLLDSESVVIAGHQSAKLDRLKRVNLDFWGSFRVFRVQRLKGPR